MFTWIKRLWTDEGRFLGVGRAIAFALGGMAITYPDLIGEFSEPVGIVLMALGGFVRSTTGVRK